MLAAVLEFRNMHVELPCFCKPLGRALRESFSLGYIIHDATWPMPQHAVQSGLAQFQSDGKLAVSSEDGVAQVVLHEHRRRFAVCFPLLVGERPQEVKYEYTWQTQVFCVESFPERWRPAVEAALGAAELMACDPVGQPSQYHAAAAQQADSAHSQRNPDGTPSNPDDLTLSGASCTSMALPPPSRAARSTQLPRADESARSGLADQLPSNGWWGEPSLSVLPSGHVLTLEWTPHATYHYLSQQGEVEAWVHADESCLLSCRGGRFIAHFKDPAGPEQLYAAHCVPDAVWARDQACRYPLASLAAHALKVRSHNLAVATATAAAAAHAAAPPLQPRPPGVSASTVIPASTSNLAASTRDLFAVASTTVLEESAVPGQGHFTAYEDGRVRVVFDDRAILHVAASHTHCKAVLPDGTATVVSVANPVGVEGYVAAAVDFARWAFKTPAERGEELRTAARVRAELLSCRRMAVLCEHATRGVLPVDAGAGQGGRLTYHGGRDGKDVRQHTGEQAVSMLPRPADMPGPMGDLGTCGGTGPELGHGSDRQAMIEQLLSRNARLLERL